MKPHSARNGYRPDIDGLRAFSIVAVVIYHAFPASLPGGFVGVDVFFVISGYLITSIILSAGVKGEFSLAGFYRRRIQRLLPALILVLCSTLLAGWFVLLPLEYETLGKHTVTAALFVPNIMFWSEAGYFDVDSMLKPLLHLWSLGIEEQFYVLWPVVLLFALRVRLAPLLVIFALLCTSFAMSVVPVELGGADQASLFFLPQYRAWELLLGALLATVHLRNPLSDGFLSGALGLIAAFLGLVLMCLAVFVITKERIFPGWWALLPTVGCALVIASHPDNWLSRVILGNGLLVYIGKISFPFYLWHWPLFSLARIVEVGEPSNTIKFALIVLSALLAWLTHELVEKKLRYHESKFVPAFLVAALLALGYFGVVLTRNDGFAVRHEALNEKARQFLWQEEGYFSRFQCPKNHPRQQYCLRSRKKPEVAVLGDSHSSNTFVALMEHYKNTDTGVVRLTQPNCPPLYNTTNRVFSEADECLAANNGNIDWVAQQPDIHTVYLSSMGSMYLSKNARRYQMASVSQPELKSRKDIFAAGLSASIDRLLNAQKKVVMVVDWPGLPFSPKECVDFRPFRLTPFEQHPCTMPVADHLRRNSDYQQVVEGLAKAFPMLLVWNTPAVFCDEQVCKAIYNDKVLYRDPGHLSFYGSNYLGQNHTLVTAEQFLISLDQ